MSMGKRSKQALELFTIYSKKTGNHRKRRAENDRASPKAANELVG
jgi:hypothetical protein